MLSRREFMGWAAFYAATAALAIAGGVTDKRGEEPEDEGEEEPP